MIRPHATSDLRPTTTQGQTFDGTGARPGGEHAPGHLTAAVRLERDFGVARATVQKVTAALREDGLIRAETGMGSFATDRTR